MPRDIKYIQREYKLPLKVDRFNGDSVYLFQKINKFLRRIEEVSTAFEIIEFDKNLSLKKKRIPEFFDTRNRDLYKNGFILRQRECILNPHFDLILKYRHKDKYLSEMIDNEFMQFLDGKYKFEEDIKPRYQVMYSTSVKLKIANKPKIDKLKNVSKYFEGVENFTKKNTRELSLEKVGKYNIEEQVYSGAYIDISVGKSIVNIPIDFVVWYDKNVSMEKPVYVEFSYKFLEKRDKMTTKKAKFLYSFFKSLQDLSKWIDVKQMSKTGFVYLS